MAMTRASVSRSVAAVGMVLAMGSACGDDPGKSSPQDPLNLDGSCAADCNLDGATPDAGHRDASEGDEDATKFDAALPLIWAEGHTFLVTDVEPSGRKSLWFLSTSGSDAYRVSDDALASDVEDARLSPDGTHVLYYAQHEQGFAVDLAKLGPLALQGRSRIAHSAVSFKAKDAVHLTVTESRFLLAYLHDELPTESGGESLFLQEFNGDNEPSAKALVHRPLLAGERVSSARFVTPNHLVYRASLSKVPALFLHQFNGTNAPVSAQISPDIESSVSGVGEEWVSCGQRPTLAFEMNVGPDAQDEAGVLDPRHVLVSHLSADTPFPALTLTERAGAYLVERTVCSRDGLALGYESAAKLFVARTTTDTVTQRAGIATPWGADAARYTLTPVMAPSGKGLFIVVTDGQDGHSDLWFGDVSGAEPATPVKIAKLAGGVRSLDAENNGHLVVDRLRDRVYVVREDARGAAQASTLDVVDGRVRTFDIGGELPGNQRVVRLVCAQAWDICYGVTASQSFDRPGIELWSLDPRAKDPSPTHLAGNLELLVGDIELRLVDHDRAMVVSGRLKDGTTRNYLLDLKSDEVRFGLIAGKNLSEKFWVADLHRISSDASP